mgnify:CR=1 FL=1
MDVEFPENGYHGYDIVETAKRIVKIYGDKFLHMDEQERLHEFRTIALKEKLAALKEDLEPLTSHLMSGSASRHCMMQIRSKKPANF